MNLNEKDVSTKQHSPQTHAWVSHPHEHDSRSSRAQPAPDQGSQKAYRADPSQASKTIDAGISRSRFPKAARLLARREFLSLQQRGKRRYCPHFVVVLVPAQGNRSRLGIIVTRRFGNAVIRNRMKRILREFFRSRQNAIIPAQDILIIPRAGAELLTSTQVAEELRRALSIADETI
jgi:ribonuclease P protein component